MTVKAVLFDFDGTLIDSVDSVWREYQRTASALKLPEKKFEDFARQLGKPWEIALQNIWPGVDTERFTEVYRLEKEQAKAVEGVTETLGRLRGRYRLGILTSRGSRTLYMHLDSTGIGRDFDVILDRDSLRNHKPDPKALYQACEELHIKPDEAVYVGDSIVDAECALKAGIRFVGVLTGGASRREFEKNGVRGGDVLENLKTLPEKLEGMRDGI